MIPATPVCMARLASSYDRMSPFPEGQRLGSQGAACRWELWESSCQPGDTHEGREGSRRGGGAGRGVQACGPRESRAGGRAEPGGGGPTEQGHGAGRRHALLDVLPVGQLGVALLPRSAVELKRKPRAGREDPGGGESDTEKETQRDQEGQAERERQRGKETDGDRDERRAREQEGETGREGPLGRAAERSHGPDTLCAPRPTVTRAAPQSRSSGSSRCARFTRSWTPVRIFTVRGTSSTCGDGYSQRGPGLGWGQGRDVEARTWFMPRTICWNLAERFMRAQPPPWGKMGGWSKGGQDAGRA